jgi:hypothetical protein
MTTLCPERLVAAWLKRHGPIHGLVRAGEHVLYHRGSTYPGGDSCPAETLRDLAACWEQMPDGPGKRWLAAYIAGGFDILDEAQRDRIRSDLVACLTSGD